MTQSEALTILKTGANVFLTGEPGAGKTYTINEYIRYLREHSIEPAIAASTGIASTHIGGMTIHSWAGIGIKNVLTEYDLDLLSQNKTLSTRISRTKVLIIDEISMLSARTFGMVDMVCRVIKGNSEPFGGIQVVVVGDFFQLPPISRGESISFAFESNAWKEMNFVTCYLDTQFRQDDDEFLSVLSAIRSNSFEEMHLEYLQNRKIERHEMPADVTKLFPHNLNVDKINDGELLKIEDYGETYLMTSKGRDTLILSLKKSCLSPETLVLKRGAIVMFTKNDPSQGYVNGTIGEVLDFDGLTSNPIVLTKEGKKITVTPMDWTIEEDGKVKARITQLPLRLAWAITVHKSQGMSLDAAIMDLSLSFAYGQGYVALSRVRRLSGLYILGWNQMAFQVHPDILEKDIEFKANSRDAVDKFLDIEEAELAKMHQNFILASGGKIEKVNIKDITPRSPKITTVNETLKFIKDKNNLKDIAEKRGLTVGTIVQHIEELIQTEAIGPDDLVSIIDAQFLKKTKIINKVFDEISADTLKPVFEKLKGVYSYDDLKIARLLYKSKSN